MGGGYDLDEEEQSEYGDFEEDYGEESLERRLARLRKEVEVLKGEIANREEEERNRKEEEIKQAEDGGEEGREKERELRLGIDDLSDVLEGLQTISGEERGAQAKLAKKLATSLAVAAAPKTAGQAVSEKGSPEVRHQEVLCSFACWIKELTRALMIRELLRLLQGNRRQRIQ